MKKKIAVIGGGLGGLSAAIRLAKQGFEVQLFEQNGTTGGKANSISKSGFRFDTGPSLITMPFVLQELIEYSGENINDYIELKPLEVLCKYFYSDGLILKAFAEREKLVAELSSKLEENPDTIHKYLDYSKRIYELTADLFLFKSFADPSTFFNKKALNTLFNLHHLDPFRSMHKANSTYFKNEKTVQLFDRYATYNGSNPYLAPATLNIIQHVEFNLGAFISTKGIFAIPTALNKIAMKLGVEIHNNSRVDKILFDNKGINGIELNGKRLEFDAVVSNADVNYTYKNLLGEHKSKAFERYAKHEPSSSAIVFYWGIKGTHAQLEIHNILFSSDYKKEFDDLFSNKQCHSDPTVYIYISSKFNPDDAPDGCENWFVMINAPYNCGQDWQTEVARMRGIIIKKIEKILGIDIETKIITESILDPVLIETNTSSRFGSLYGISSNNKYAAFLRQNNRSKEYKGLYFCGGSAHPGGGIPLVLLSGKITSELISKDFG
jgi:phytoene desaturase